MINQMLMHDARKLFHSGMIKGARVCPCAMQPDRYWIQLVLDDSVREQYGEAITRQRGGLREFATIDGAATTIRDIGFRRFEVVTD